MDHAAKKRRFFVPDLPDSPGGVVELPTQQAHHAAGVLRLKSDAEVALFDGCGAVAQGRLVDVGRGKVTARIDRIDLFPRAGPLVHLAFSVPKGKRLDWLLEKATELGAAALQPVVFERSVDW